MPMPVNNNCSARSIKALMIGTSLHPGAPRISLKGFRNRRPQNTAAAKAPAQNYTGSLEREPAARLVVEVDVLVVNDGALFVPHDIVAVQTVAILIEIVFALGARGLLGGKQSFADFARIGRTRLVDGGGQDSDGIVGPCALVVGRGLVSLTIGFAERLRRFAGFFRVIRHSIGSEQGRTRELGRRDRYNRWRANPWNVDAELTKLPREYSEVVLEG